MEKFIIDGGYPLSGEVTPSGNKNAALPMLAACLMASVTATLVGSRPIYDVLRERMLAR